MATEPLEGAVRDYGADAAFTLEEMDEKLPKYVENADLIHYRFGRDAAFDQKIFELVKNARFMGGAWE